MKKQQLEQKEQVNTAWMIPKAPCWVQISNEDSDTFPDLFAPAEIVELLDNKVAVHYTKHEGLPSTVGCEILYQQNNYEDDGFIDMVVMEALNEAEILHNIRVRYAKTMIFTYIGPTLIVMNPYKSISNQLGSDVLKLYQDQTKSPNPFNIRDTPPHAFAIAAYSYRKLFENSKNQAIVISGESGAGKTENAKIAMQFLTSLSESESGVVESERIEEKIMACNPILESFGNAKTTRNDNSSRFGKYVRIIVNSESRRIKGAAINNYLLEKSRVVEPGPSERNYHVFYAMLKGASPDQLQGLHLTKDNGELMTAMDFEILRIGDCIEVPSVNDKKWFDELIESFHHIQFNNQELDTVLRSLAAVLLLGNLKFDPSTLTDKNPCGFLTPDVVTKVSSLLDVTVQELTKMLTIKTREVGKTLIESPLNEADAYSNRNALAANLYDRLFSWLVKRLNLTIIPKEDLQTTDIRKSIRIIKRQSILGIKLSIGLLDIFGFENFKHNSFEQFSINYTNEKLQQLYIAYVFKSEEQEFINEGLKDYLSQLNYSDNTMVIELMDKPAAGIFDLIDEVTQLGSGTDDALIQKIAKTFKDHKNIIMPKAVKDKFTIIHTAKNVEYNIQGFRSKNKSEISNDLVKGIMSSKNDLLQNIFLVLCGKEISQKEEELEKMKKPSKTEKFLGAKFRSQMKQLMEELSTSDCHFIRCLKPNEIKKPEIINASYCLLQIKYLGILESIKVRKEGFPYRKDYKVFYQQFHEISPEFRQISIFKQKGDLQQITQQIIKQVAPNAQLLIGKTKFFGKDSLGRQLDLALAEWHKKKNNFVKKIQRTAKTYLFKKKFKEYLHKLVVKIRKFYVIMAHFRRRRQRKIFLRKKEAIQRSNKVYWQIIKRSGLQLYSQKVRLIIKHEQQKKALQLLIQTLAKVKARRGYQKLRQQVLNIRNMLKSFKCFQTKVVKRKSQLLRHWQSQVKLKQRQILEALEKKRIEEERIRQELELKRQEDERIRLEEERKRLEEERRQEQKRQDDERKRNEEERQKQEEIQRLALLKAGKQAEAEQLKRDAELRQQKAAEQEKLILLQQQREQKEAEEQQKLIDKENADRLEREKQDKEKQRIAELEKSKKNENKQEIIIIPDAININNNHKQDSQPQENQKREQVQKPLTQIIQIEEVEEQQIHKQHKIQKAQDSPKQVQEPQKSQSTDLKQQVLEQTDQKQQLLFTTEQKQQRELEQDESKSQKSSTQFQDDNSEPNQGKQLQKKMSMTSQFSDDEEQKDEIPQNYLSNDFFGKPKDDQPVIQQSGLKRGEVEEDPSVSRKRITVSNNILPFVPKDHSDFERVLVDRHRYKAHQIQFDQFPTSNDFGYSLEKIDKTFMKKVTTSHFLDYCLTVVRKRKKMFQEVPIDKVMQWSNAPLEKALTHIPATLENQYKLVSVIIGQFSGESKSLSTNAAPQLCEDLIKIIFPYPSLIDEVYLLVLKQIIRNSTPTQIKYCQLLSGLSSSVAPSPKALFPIMNFLEIGSMAFQKREVINLQNAKNPLIIGIQGEQASELLKFAFLRLMKTFSRTRLYPPSSMELQLTFLYRQILNNVDYVFIEPHYTERQLMEQVVKKFKMYPNWENIGICKCQGYCETFLDEKSLVIDTLREIEDITNQVKKSGKQQHIPYLAVRIKVFFVFQPADLDSICLYYIHFVNEYMKGNYPVNKEQATLLGCMKLISESGCYHKNKNQIPVFTPQQFIPGSVLDEQNWQHLINEKYKQYPHVDEMEARARFLEEVRKYYPCNYQQGKDEPKAICLAIRPFQIYLCDSSTRDIKQRYHFLQVILWGQQKDQISIETDDGIEHKFKMLRGVEDAIGFNSIMKTYMDRAMLQQQGV